jgi:diguanylate cyclase (GGDEF)-like protein
VAIDRAFRMTSRRKSDYGPGEPAAAPVRQALTLSGPRTSDQIWGVGTQEDQTLHATIEMGQVFRERARLTTPFRALTFEDQLCGLPNRLAFDERFAELTRGDPASNLAVLLLDLDNFTQLNDWFGRTDGDHALRLVANALRHDLRIDDLPARLGGDEFAALLSAIEPEDARVLAERIQQRVSELSGSYRLTVSVGISWFDGDRSRTMLKTEAALHRAKSYGRNRVCMTRLTGAEEGWAAPAVENWCLSDRTM